MERFFPFEGVLNNVNRRYKETESGYIREELSKLISLKNCQLCEGTRLREEARNVFIEENRLPEITCLTIDEAFNLFSKVSLSGTKKEIADRIIKEIKERLEFLIDVGLNYLTLDRSAESLSGGEAQRIRLASQIGAGLVGVTYILDEPSIGLEPRFIDMVFEILQDLQEKEGKTIIMVEQNAKKGLEFADIGYVLVSGNLALAGSGDELLANPAVGRLFLGG